MPQGNPKSGELYIHFKQKMYQIVTIAEHSETREKLVIYQALYGEYKIYARPLEMFISLVDTEKYPQVKQKYRFQIVENPNIEHRQEMAAAEQEKGPLTEEEKLMAFFDADTIEEKYKALINLEECITDRMINNMAVVLDVVIEDGPVEKRFEELKRCVRMIQKYETTRLR